jgi:hypothetical protein
MHLYYTTERANDLIKFYKGSYYKGKILKGYIKAFFTLLY